MSLLTPERVPVKVYRWDDDGAPALDKTAGCMMAIFESCLVTGYGTKEPAGWTMLFEDAGSEVKLLKPASSPHTDFCLRLSGDTGGQVSARVCVDATNATDGKVVTQAQTDFMYGFAGAKKWVLIATPRGLWMFIEADGKNGNNRHGLYYTLCETGANQDGIRGVYCRFTGGEWGTGGTNRRSIFEDQQPNGTTQGIFYKSGMTDGVVATASSYWNGLSDATTLAYASQVFITADNDQWPIPAYGNSNRDYKLFDVVDSGSRFVCGSTTLWDDQNILVPIDYWEF